MNIIQENDPIQISMPGNIKFSNNQELMLHINKKYTDKNFYVMSGPVGLTVEGAAIEAKTRKCRTMVDLEPFAEKELKLTEGSTLLEDIVEPIIEEIIAGTAEKDIYLYMILPTGSVINPKTNMSRMCYLVRGYF